ncbi:MAG TPA: mechanosensitive ion channel domain-containing protein [Hanamia sp.]|nr:mechanosensitive ion channel domain-containing protein [Hanamia sp.]
MKKIISITFIALLFFLAGGSLYAQKDSVKAPLQNDSIARQNDSINSAILQNFNKNLNEIERLRVSDSITKANLEKQIGSLQNTDNLKKEELQKQLEQLKNKEALRFAEKKKQIDSLRLTAKGYPVVGFFNDTLFYIFNESGSFTAAERAEAIQQRIKALAHNYRFKKDSVQLVSNESSTDLVLNDKTIMSISDNDAIWENTTRDQLAQRYQNIIIGEVLKYKKETNLTTLAKEILLALLLIALFVFVIKYIAKLFRWTRIKIRKQKDGLLKGIKIKNYTLFDASMEVKFFLNVNNVVKWLLIFLVVYLSLPVIFGIFPWTKNYASTLFGYILNPVKSIALSFWNFIPNLITIIVILFVFRYVFKGLRYLKNEIKNEELNIPGFYPDWANPTYQIIRVLVFAFMIVVIYPYLPGSNSRVFQGVSVFLGFLFTFGSAGSLSNLISGLVLTYMRLFKIGDRVKIGDQVGDVIEKSLLVTRIRTIKNEIISIPNSTVMNSHTVNYSSEAPGLGLIINTTVTIGYDTAWREMHEALIEAALRTELVLKDPKPFVLQTGLEDFYVSYQINAYIRESNKQATIYSSLYQNIQDVCNEKGIEIMSPHYFSARDGNETTIPPTYLPKDYKAPGFTIRTENNNGKENNGESK